MQKPVAYFLKKILVLPSNVMLELEKQAKGNKKLLALLETFKVSGQEEDGFAIRIGNICRCLWCPRPKDEKDSPEQRTTMVRARCICTWNLKTNKCTLNKAAKVVAIGR